MKRHHKLIVAAILLLVAGWFAWNTVLVESDTSAPGQEAPPQAPANR